MQNAQFESRNGTSSPYWGALDPDLHSRVFLGCRNIACAVCSSVTHSTMTCPQINPSLSPYPEPISVKSSSYVPRSATAANSDPERTAPSAADKRQPCIAFNFWRQRCNRQCCRYLHIGSFCGRAHAHIVCPVYKAVDSHEPFLSAIELAHHLDK